MSRLSPFLVVCSISTQIRLAPAARSMAPPTAGMSSLVGRRPVGEIAVLGDLKGAEHAKIEMAAADQREAVGVMHVGAARDAA